MLVSMVISYGISYRYVNLTLFVSISIAVTNR